MLNQNAQQWVKALRSGKYKQIQGSLTMLAEDQSTIMGCCCLGVACEVYQDFLGDLEVGKSKFSAFIKSYSGEDNYLPECVQNWLGLTTPNGCVNEPLEDSVATLTGVNDGGWTFDQIANLIESEPEGLFV